MQIEVTTPTASLIAGPLPSRRGFAIRRADPAHDMPELQRMAKAFHSAWLYAERDPIDLASFAKTVTNIAKSPSGVVLVAEMGGRLVGMTAAISMPHWFNHKHITGQELFWWADEEARGTGAGLAMLAALEDWARDFGCKSFVIASTVNLKPEKLEKLYKRRGYSKFDIFYQKEF